jgi:hypothetical protein
MVAILMSRENLFFLMSAIRTLGALVGIFANIYILWRVASHLH